ncbi:MULTISPECIES: hypothetical protein [unclassified Candidatus Frackibacter]|uniref:hypothetical protein n=1 Tax=unclassified Candidatus Frackibacter TaxID=2648818 RepID=UPI00079867DA|nr:MULTISPECIES: hypothetical protein [unclassified Candidatus Frackibacter]KXS45109.1 MAG: hypothetical protein AWU54_618 [Candidatus Frackibacter sp. T328-2]SDB96276.1 hypothetical protein SAMN04515661_10110 [Candidatus Frackibacter sp. WG11]SEM27710.1 hypothetical protein SAMN04488698_10111 [Candidatus Frackibacter sp. WG12]SFL32476.1 hypothetical protein SAMN04488699_10111 [Candidatus Frackibacter sp. WG13]
MKERLNNKGSSNKDTSIDDGLESTTEPNEKSNQTEQIKKEKDNDTDDKINLPEELNENETDKEDINDEEANNKKAHISPVISTCSSLKDTACMLRTFADDLDQLVDTVEPMIQLANKDATPYSQQEIRDKLKVSSDNSTKKENNSKQNNNSNLQSLISQSGSLDKSSLNNILMQVVMQSLLKQLMPNND